MLKIALCVMLSAALIRGAMGQQIVHAVSGTVMAVHPATRMIDLSTDDGSSGHFLCADSEHAFVNFNKDVKASSTPADKFTADGSHVVVYYFGNGSTRTAVAVHELGKNVVTEMQGTVSKFDRHAKTLTLTTKAGTEETFRLNPKTVADTPTGVVENLKFSFDKGSSVNVTASQENGVQMALLITPVM